MMTVAHVLIVIIAFLLGLAMGVAGLYIYWHEREDELIQDLIVENRRVEKLYEELLSRGD